MLVTPITKAATDERAFDPGMLKAVLRPYKPHCQYLKHVTIECDRSRAGAVVANGEFGIPESCYIADTGHFNAVEFNICYNQLAYCLVAHSVEHGLIPALNRWNFDEFTRRQLSDCLIVQFTSSFRRPMKAADFRGRIAIEKVAVRKDTIFLRTTCSFTDGEGQAEGGALLAIVGENARSQPKTAAAQQAPAA